MHPVMPGMHGMPGPFPMMQMPPQFYQMSPAQQMQYQQVGAVASVQDLHLVAFAAATNAHVPPNDATARHDAQ